MLLNKVKSLPMRGLIAAISASVSMMFLTVIFINNIALSELKISGPIYQEIVREKDLLADILPPPNYVIEAYLVLTMLRDAVAPAERQDLTQRYQGLKRDYANRMAYWRTQPLPPDTADLFLRKSHELVTDLFATADQRLLPAILEGKGDVRQAYRAVSDLYERHRSTVDRIVARANEIMAETERNAAASERSFSTLTTMIAVAAFALLIGSLALLYYAVARPVGQAARMLARLAEGQDDVVVEQLQGNGEVPTLWRSVEALRQTTRQAFRQGQALDQMAAPIMMAEGPDLTITYINQCSLTLLRTLEQYLPCRADEVIGKSVDIFHANPAGPRRILSDPGRLPHVARVSLGPESMELRICPIFDRSGSYVGPLLAWELVTAQVTLVKSFEAEVGSVIADVTAEARKIADISNEMASRQESGTSRSITVADAADSTSTDIQNLAAAAEQLASSIDEISRQVSMASSTTRAGVANVDGVADQIARLKSAAAEIGGVVQLIHQIAGQTNLLALNATIEAARAGEAGKGFAVVASEVKALANQTAKATEEISRRIESIQEETDAAVTGFAQVRGVIGTVDEIASSIAAGVEEQSAVTKEITRSVASVTRDMQQVAGSISDVTMGSIRSGAGAINVLWSAESLKTASLRLSSASEAFLTRIKAF